MKRYQATTTNKAGHGGYYGSGDTVDEALASAKLACSEAGESWKRENRRVVRDTTTGEEVYRIGKK